MVFVRKFSFVENYPPSSLGRIALRFGEYRSCVHSASFLSFIVRAREKKVRRKTTSKQPSVIVPKQIRSIAFRFPFIYFALFFSFRRLRNNALKGTELRCGLTPRVVVSVVFGV